MTTRHQQIAHDVVKARDVKLQFTPVDVRRHWFANDPWMTQLFNSLSFMIPDGERWVMESARKQVGKLDDPELARVVREFIRQEAAHSRETDAMNALMSERGLPVEELARQFADLRKRAQSLLGDDMQASIAAAIEHFTAILSEVLLQHPELYADMDEKARALAIWHMVEETEHKAVSYDLFTRTVGDDSRAYAMRVAGLALTFVFGFGVVVAGQGYLLKQDRQLGNLQSLRRYAGFLFTRERFALHMFGAGLPYLRPSFHPWDRDNRELVKVWRDEYQRTGDAVQATNKFLRSQLSKATGQRAPRPVRLRAVGS